MSGSNPLNIQKIEKTFPKIKLKGGELKEGQDVDGIGIQLVFRIRGQTYFLTSQNKKRGQREVAFGGRWNSNEKGSLGEKLRDFVSQQTFGLFNYADFKSLSNQNDVAYLDAAEPHEEWWAYATFFAVIEFESEEALKQKIEKLNKLSDFFSPLAGLLYSKESPTEAELLEIKTQFESLKKDVDFLSCLEQQKIELDEVEALVNKINPQTTVEEKEALLKSNFWVGLLGNRSNFKIVEAKALKDEMDANPKAFIDPEATSCAINLLLTPQQNVSISQASNSLFSGKSQQGQVLGQVGETRSPSLSG